MDKDKRLQNAEDRVANILEAVTPSLEGVNNTIRKYSNNPSELSLDWLESVKRELINLMVDISDAHGQLKVYHMMYTEGRKTKKSEVFEKLIEEGKNTTAADKLVYKEKEYTDYMSVLGVIEKAYQVLNSKYYLIDNTLSALQQSIANARKIENS